MTVTIPRIEHLLNTKPLARGAAQPLSASWRQSFVSLRKDIYSKSLNDSLRPSETQPDGYVELTVFCTSF